MLGIVITNRQIKDKFIKLLNIYSNVGFLLLDFASCFLLAISKFPKQQLCHAWLIFSIAGLIIIALATFAVNLSNQNSHEKLHQNRDILGIGFIPVPIGCWNNHPVSEKKSEKGSRIFILFILDHCSNVGNFGVYCCQFGIGTHSNANQHHRAPVQWKFSLVLPNNRWILFHWRSILFLFHFNCIFYCWNFIFSRLFYRTQ